MKLIKLSKGKFAQVDDEDYDRILQFAPTWRADKKRSTWYAVCSTWDAVTRKRGYVGMHCVILNTVGTKSIVDHKDRNGLNNQRDNLRVCTFFGVDFANEKR